MNSLQLRTAFRRLFAQWYLLGLAARCLQFTLIFEAVSQSELVSVIVVEWYRNM